MPSNEYTLDEAARILGKSKETVRRMAKKGDLDAHMVSGPHGRQYRITLPTHAPQEAQEATLPATIPSPVLAILGNWRPVCI